MSAADRIRRLVDGKGADHFDVRISTLTGHDLRYVVYGAKDHSAASDLARDDAAIRLGQPRFEVRVSSAELLTAPPPSLFYQHGARKIMDALGAEWTMIEAHQVWVYGLLGYGNSEFHTLAQHDFDPDALERHYQQAIFEEMSQVAGGAA